VKVSSDLDDSVILITSESSEIPDFGSGFVIYQDEGTTFLLTCAHVVKDVGGATKIRVGTDLATIVELGEEKGCDLAVLKVNGLLEKLPLKLSNSASKGRRIVISGYYQNETKVKTQRKISGVIGERIVLELDGNRTIAWDIEIDESSKYSLQPGYSGSPVIDEQTGATIGVISQSEGIGRQGLAISIEAVRKIWREIPDSLLQDELNYLRDEVVLEEKTIEESGEEIEKIGFQLRNRNNQPLTEALNWLANRSRLAKKVGEEALKRFPNIAKNLEEEYADQFYLDIESYLELISCSLETGRFNLLHEPVVSQSQPNPALYRLALQLIKQRIPEPPITENERKELEARIDYLLTRLP
jgi:hypothetical protein